MTTPLKIGAILFPGFEMLDLFGPLEMFSLLGTEVVEILTVAEQPGLVATSIGANGPVGPEVNATYSFDEAPKLDIILLPGGFGTFPQLENEKLLSFLKTRSAEAQITASVCTGSALLAKAGILDGHKATSNKQFFSLAVAQSDKVEWIEEARWVESGNVITSSGVSAGMDMSIAIIKKLLGEEAAQSVINAAEYTWHEDADSDPFVAHLNELADLMP